MGSFIMRVKGPEDTKYNPANAYLSTLVIKATAGRLYALVGTNAGPDQWIQLHDSTGTPTNATLRVILYVPTTALGAASTNFSFDWGNTGIPFTSGIVVANSLTGPTYTAGATDCWFHGTFR